MGAEDGRAEGEEGGEDGAAVRVVFEGEGVGAGGGDEGVLVVVVFGDPGLEGGGEGGVGGEDLPDFGWDVI